MKNSSYRWFKVFFILSLVFFIPWVLIIWFATGANPNITLSGTEMIQQALPGLIPGFVAVIGLTFLGLTIDLSKKYNIPRWIKYFIVVYVFLGVSIAFVYSLNQIIGPINNHPPV